MRHDKKTAMRPSPSFYLLAIMSYWPKGIADLNIPQMIFVKVTNKFGNWIITMVWDSAIQGKWAYLRHIWVNWFFSHDFIMSWHKVHLMQSKSKVRDRHFVGIDVLWPMRASYQPVSRRIIVSQISRNISNASGSIVDYYVDYEQSEKRGAKFFLT